MKEYASKLGARKVHGTTLHACTQGDTARAGDSVAQKPRAELASLDSFAPMIDVSRSKLYALIKRGMPHVRVGATLRVPVTEALAWLKAGGGAS